MNCKFWSILIYYNFIIMTVKHWTEQGGAWWSVGWAEQILLCLFKWQISALIDAHCCMADSGRLSKSRAWLILSRVCTYVFVRHESHLKARAQSEVCPVSSVCRWCAHGNDFVSGIPWWEWTAHTVEWRFGEVNGKKVACCFVLVWYERATEQNGFLETHQLFPFFLIFTLCLYW